MSARRLAAAAAILAAMLAAPPAAWAARGPNVLFITVDDQNAALGCYGNTLVQSPNIDALARRGVRFDRAYCQYALCNPSRSSFLTGLRPDTTRVFDEQTHFRNTIPDVVTLPEAFRRAGYVTARVGKIFNQEVPRQIGTRGMDDPASWDKVVDPAGRDVSDADEDAIIRLVPNLALGRDLSFLADGGTDAEQTDGLVASSAIQLLQEYRDQPFFLGVGFYRPHLPWVAPAGYFARYPRAEIVPPFVPPDDRATKPAAALTVNPPNYGLDPVACNAAIWGYYASVSFVDAQIGQVLAALDQLGLSNNTIVVLLGDHGYHLGEHGLWQKETLYEEAARAPLIIAVPGAATAGATSPCLVELVDIYPTLIDLCGVPDPGGLQGMSLRPLLAAPQVPIKAAALTQVKRFHRGPQFMGRSVRTDRWRYTEWDNGAQGVELYDHLNDPLELVNLALNPAYAATIASLRPLLTPP